MTTDDEPDLTALPWRVGRKNPRNMYAVTGDDWAVHWDIGKLDTAELAAEACRSHNAALERRLMPAPLAAEIREALDRTERGEAVDLGSFAQYADDEPETATEAKP
jgi:hypothetical protein